MKLSKIYEIANEIAPKALSDEYCKSYGAYDNSGLLVEACEEVNGVVFSLDLTDGAIDKALEMGAELIIAHHPMIYGKIDHICQSDETLLGGKLVRCIQNGISVICMHLNLDVAKDGIDDCLMEGVCRCAGERKGVGTRSMQIMHPVCDSGYGKAYNVPEISLGVLADNIGKEFSTKRIALYGDENRKIARIASFCGAGADENSIAYAKRMGADVVISSDFKHHLLLKAVELDMAVIVLTHYASENYGFKNYYEKIRRQIEIPCVYHVEDKLL